MPHSVLPENVWKYLLHCQGVPTLLSCCELTSLKLRVLQLGPRHSEKTMLETKD